MTSEDTCGIVVWCLKLNFVCYSLVSLNHTKLNHTELKKMIEQCVRVCAHVSSVKWGHLGHFDLEPNFLTNPTGSSGPLWARLYNNNYKNQNKN